MLRVVGTRGNVATTCMLRRRCQVTRPPWNAPRSSRITHSTASSTSPATTTTSPTTILVPFPFSFSTLAVPKHVASVMTADTLRALGLGTMAGTVTSMAGLGGALLMIPLLTAAPLRLSQHAAHGTALVAVATTNAVGAWTFRKYLVVPNTKTDATNETNVDDCDSNTLWATAAMAVAGMVTARWGARFSTRLPARTLKRALGSLMVTLSIAVPLKDAVWQSEEWQALYLRQNENTYNKMLDERIIPYTMVGAASGYLAGLFGVGGGTLAVPALTLLSCSKDDTSCHHHILATSLTATALPAMVGAWTHYRAGNVVLRVAPALAAGAAVGALLGGTLAHHMDETTLRQGLTILLAVLGTRTLVAGR